MYDPHEIGKPIAIAPGSSQCDLVFLPSHTGKVPPCLPHVRLLPQNGGYRITSVTPSFICPDIGRQPLGIGLVR